MCVGYEQPKISNVITVADHIDVALCALDYFQRLLEDHVPWAVAFAYYPPCGIVFETKKLEHKHDWRQQKRALTVNCTVNINQAAALWRNKDEYKARKRVFFVLQMTIFATQIVSTGRIYDFWEEANALRPTLFDSSLKTWAAFAAVYKPMYDYYVNRYILLRNAYRFHEVAMLTMRKEGRSVDVPGLISVIYQYGAPAAPQYVSESNNTDSEEHWPALVRTLRPNYAERPGFPLVCDYIRKHGLASLGRDLSIIVKRHPQWPSLIHLSRTPTLTPHDSIIGRECHGLLLDETTCSPVAWSHHHVFNIQDDLSIVFSKQTESSIGTKKSVPASDGDLTQFDVVENIDGVLISLFYWEGAWQTCSVAEPDASEIHTSSTRPVSQVFWETWHHSNASVDALDKTKCYSFWLLHPEARNRILHQNVPGKLLLESCLFWGAKGCVRVPLQDLSRILPFDVVPKAKFNHPVKAILDDLDDLPLGGVVLQHRQDPHIRFLVPSNYMKRLDEITRLQVDQLLQEIEMAQFLIEQLSNDSAWNYPLIASLPTFQTVSKKIQELIETLDKHVPTLNTTSKEDLSLLQKDLGEPVHFLFLMKTVNPLVSTSTEFFKTGPKKRILKYFEQWWRKEHAVIGDRSALQYSYK